MKKWLIGIPLVILILVLVVVGIVHVYLNSRAPEYKGDVDLECLDREVQVRFDDFGIPHINAQSASDAYKALGYIVASERLFQLEMMRRVGTGQLAEVLGSDFISTDALFRALFPPEYFEKEVARLEASQNRQMLEAVDSYLAGINEFAQSGPKPFEFTLLGIDAPTYTRADVFAIAGYMAYSFGLAQRTDPLITYIHQEFGDEYLRGASVIHEQNEPFNPSYDAEIIELLSQDLFGQAKCELPVPVWHGSNSWVVSGERTSSGFPIFCNDTHIAYNIPQVWYEAHMVYPDNNFYGYYLAGVPFALVGHNDFMSWGLTMLEHDDMDFYMENIDAERTMYYMDDAQYPLQNMQTTIRVKDHPDTTITISSTHHGPLVQPFYDQLSDQIPVAMWWDYIRHPNNLLEAFYSLNNCRSLDQAENAASQIHGPGLNVMYADTLNNIAWWASAKLLIRPPHIHGKFVIDGSVSSNDPVGYYPFESNPHSVNPPWNFVYSANDQPGPMADSSFYPGYYKPSHRADRIKELLTQPITWNVEQMKEVMTDVVSTKDRELCALLHQDLTNWLGGSTPVNLLIWDGDHEVDAEAPFAYYRLMYHTLKLMMEDELGATRMANCFTTHWFQRNYVTLISTEDSPWWDNQSTPRVETRKEIITDAWEMVCRELGTLSSQNHEWNWGDVHQLTLKHPFSEHLPFLAGELNIGPYPIRGGFETVCQASFTPDSNIVANVRLGSQMRIIRDMGDLTQSISVTPSGQSGHFRSPHYRDQAKLYRLGEFRSEMWDPKFIKDLPNVLILN
ncbi:MAG: penicillin acylase family protein [Flavobacteriales bacterium]|nr:penicillin acylase family protein [Flavobacteriales bacterium]